MGQIELERLEGHDLPLVRALLGACRECLVLASTRPIGREAPGLLDASLPGGAPRAHRHLLGATDVGSRELIGLIDAAAYVPDAATLTVGLFLVSPFHADGPAPQVARQLLEVWAAERGMQWVRIEVSAGSWAALHFWQTAGFIPEAEPIRRRQGLIVVLEKRLGEATGLAVEPPPSWAE